jgi:SRSO17 transposase
MGKHFMLILPLPCVTAFVETLNDSLRAVDPTARLTFIQRAWLTTVLMGIIVTDMLCWAAFERRGLNRFTQEQLRWMFTSAKVAWSHLLQGSVRIVLKHYGITAGTLVLDETDKRRAKITTKITGAHKVKDKKSGGYFNGQELVFLLLVTDTVTFPVDFRFYTPDPAVSAWRKRSKEQKQQGIPAAERELRPKMNADYPQKTDLGVEMLKSFAEAFPTFLIRGVLADALYGNASFMDRAAAVTRNAQVVSELRSNQLVLSYGKNISLKRYFARQSGVATQLRIRGQQEQPVVMMAARLHVKAHGKKRFVVALRYEGEKDYRFIVASNLSWRHTDIAQLYSLRWLIEVFFEDWKAHGGWNKLTKHQGKDGSTRGVILSLLCDHLLLLHPEQSARLKNKQPGLPVGCLTERLKIAALITAVEDIVYAESPIAAMDSFTKALRDALPERSSKKHMAGLDLGRQESSPSLRYRAAA